MKIAIVVGTRPELIKMWSVLEEIDKHSDIQSLLIHTGQHYNYEMSEIFFEGLSIKTPNYYLNVGSSTPIPQIAKIMTKLEEILEIEKPDILLVQGDTNSCLAAAITSVSMKIPIGHIEAGCRSFDKTMPEETNRIVIDAVSDLLFAPSETAYQNLMQEGCNPSRVSFVGDTAVDAHREGVRISPNRTSEFKKKYCIVTIHRASNTENKHQLKEILQGISGIGIPCVFPLHPRTAKMIDTFGLRYILDDSNVSIVAPMGYLQFLTLLRDSSLVITDSGGVQTEAAMFGKPTLTIRENTEWPETIWSGLNRLVRASSNEIISQTNLALKSMDDKPALFYQNQAGQKIVYEIIKHYENGTLRNMPFPMMTYGYPMLAITKKPDKSTFMSFNDDGDLSTKKEGKLFLTRKFRSLIVDNE